MAKGETHVLPSSYIANSRMTDDCFCHMRNNVCEMAQFLREGLLGRLFKRTDGRHIEGGFPHRPIDFGRKSNLPLDQALDTRFFESVGTYQACHENATYRLNALNVWAIGYILRNAAMFCVSYKNRFQLLIDSVICTMLPKFKITRRPDGTVIDESQTYYELNVAHDPTTPKENEFYVAIGSGDLVNTNYNYYYFIPADDHNDSGFRRCAVLDPGTVAHPKRYFTKNASGTYEEIRTHVVGALTGNDIYQLLDNGTYRNLGMAHDETNKFGKLIVIIPGLTRNNTYTNPVECVLFRQVTVDDTQEWFDKLYVDCTNEDVERVKDYINIILRHYRTVLVASYRKKSRYREIIDTVPFTLEDLVVRVNAIVDCCNFTDHEGHLLINHLKLKINEIVDAINKEAFFLRLIDINDELYIRYSSMNALSDFLRDIRMNEKAWQDLIASCLRTHEQQLDSTIVHEWDGYCYNDLGFVYNPYDHENCIRIWDTLDFTQYNEPFNWMKGRIVPFPTNLGDKTEPYYINPALEKTDLSDILDLVIIADVWRACDYIGSMYVLDCTLRMFRTKSPDGDIWKDGILNPRIPVTPEQQAKLNTLLNIINDVESRLDVLFGAAPVAALTVADLGLRVSDYSVIYTCE